MIYESSGQKGNRGHTTGSTRSKVMLTMQSGAATSKSQGNGSPNAKNSSNESASSAPLGLCMISAVAKMSMPEVKVSSNIEVGGLSLSVGGSADRAGRIAKSWA